MVPKVDLICQAGAKPLYIEWQLAWVGKMPKKEVIFCGFGEVVPPNRPASQDTTHHITSLSSTTLAVSTATVPNTRTAPAVWAPLTISIRNSVTHHYTGWTKDARNISYMHTSVTHNTSSLYTGDCHYASYTTDAHPNTSNKNIKEGDIKTHPGIRES